MCAPLPAQSFIVVCKAILSYSYLKFNFIMYIVHYNSGCRNFLLVYIIFKHDTSKFLMLEKFIIDYNEIVSKEFTFMSY